MARGYTEEQVLEYFEKSYGEFILLAPKKRGLNWLVWLAPIAILLAGAALIVRRMGSPPTPAPAPESDPDNAVADDLDEYTRRVRQEVSR